MLTRLNTTNKIVLITFFSRLYFYIHINALYLQVRGLNLFEIKSIESIIIFTIFLAEVPTGVVADRIGRKWSVVMALLFQVAGEVLYLFGESYLAFSFIAIIAGIGFAFGSGATESLVYDSLPEADREQAMKQAMGRIGAASQFAFFLAPLIGGLIVSELVLDRFLVVIFLTASSVAVAFLISLTLKEPSLRQDSESPDTLAIFRGGVRELRTNHDLRFIVLLTVLTATFGGSLLTFSQPHFVNYGVSTFMIGAALSIGSLLATLTQRYAYLVEKPFGKRAGVLFATVLPGALYLLLALAAGAVPVYLLVVLLYGVNDLKKPLYSAYQNAIIPSQNRATILSLINMFSSLYVAGLALVYGAIATRSIESAFLAIGLVIVMASLLLRADRLPLVTRNQTANR